MFLLEHEQRISHSLITQVNILHYANKCNESQTAGEHLTCVDAAVHYGELVKCVVLGEHNLRVVSTAPVLSIWKVVLSPSVTGLYGGTRL